jgi:hypothetical protein
MKIGTVANAIFTPAWAVLVTPEELAPREPKESQGLLSTSAQ